MSVRRMDAMSASPAADRLEVVDFRFVLVNKFGRV